MTSASQPAASTSASASGSSCAPPAAVAAVRVMCVDDHRVLVDGLQAQFEVDNDIQCVGYLPTAERLIEEVGRIAPDLVLLDIDMPGPDVFEMAQRLRAAHPAVRYIFLSAHLREAYLAAAYKCGASGYFAKGDDLQHLVDGIRHVARKPGGAFIMGSKIRQRCQGPRRPQRNSTPADRDD